MTRSEGHAYRPCFKYERGNVCVYVRCGAKEENRAARYGRWRTVVTVVTVRFDDGFGAVLGTQGLSMHLKLAVHVHEP